MVDVSAAWAVKQYSVVKVGVGVGVVEDKARLGVLMVEGKDKVLRALMAQSEEVVLRLSEGVSLQIGGYSRHGLGYRGYIFSVTRNN